MMTLYKLLRKLRGNISVFVGITNAGGDGGEIGLEMLFQPYNLMMKKVIICI